MSFPYKHVLLIGATSGIGAAMADHLISQGINVTAVGRRKDRLDSFVSTHGSDKASSLVFDIADLDSIPAFAENAFNQHPSIDAVFLNAGIQHRCDFSHPSTVNLPRFNREITTNFTSFVALTHAFLPYLLGKEGNSGLIYTGTQISLVPAYTMPAYSASKAALDAFIMCLREQLRDTNVRVMHLSPPLVQTELHDAEVGAEVGRKMGMPVERFTDEAWKELESGKENVIIGSVGGSSKEQFSEIVERREEAFGRLAKLLRSH